MALILLIFELLLHEAHAFTLSLQSGGLSRRSKLNKLFNRFVISPPFASQHLVCKAIWVCLLLDLQSWGIMQLGKKCKILIAGNWHLSLISAQEQASSLPAAAPLWMRCEAVGGNGCWMWLPHSPEPCRKGWMGKSLFRHKITYTCRAAPRQIFFCVLEGREAWSAFSVSWQASVWVKISSASQCRNFNAWH